jgi:hypothetical protein
LVRALAEFKIPWVLGIANVVVDIVLGADIAVALDRELLMDVSK